jgi:NadR type nicotinamide-nucleotide adenylyltransferase
MMNDGDRRRVVKKNGRQRPFTVVLTGPESTGKSTLACQLAERLGGKCVREYARDYIEALGRFYTYEDVLHIFEYQLAVLQDPRWQGAPFLFLDTDLVILKVWFQEVFGKMPGNMDEVIRNRKIDLYLLCRPDIPWVYDPVRENPGERREELFAVYEQELQRAGLPYEIVGGKGTERLENALRAVKNYYKRVDSDE